MFARFLVSLAFLAFSSALAAAASFDCAKAGTPFERAICDSPELSRQDEILAKSYATALGGLSKRAADAVKKGQRAWLDYAQRACTDDAEPVTRGEYTADGVQCLGAVFMTRINRLAEGRMRNGRRVYSVDTYGVLPDPDATADSSSKVGTKEFSEPRIDGTDEEASAFNAFVDGLDFGMYAGEIDGDPMTIGSTDNLASIDVDSITDRRITLVVNDWWYGHGAAHGNYTISYRHFLTQEGREMEASDVFVGEDWWQPIAQLAFDALKGELGEDGLFATSPREIRETARSATSWNFAEEGLIIRFQPYEVTAYAAGAPTVTIPWDSLNEYMSDEGRAIVSVY